MNSEERRKKNREVMRAIRERQYIEKYGRPRPDHMEVLLNKGLCLRCEMLLTSEYHQKFPCGTTATYHTDFFSLQSLL